MLAIVTFSSAVVADSNLAIVTFSSAVGRGRSRYCNIEEQRIRKRSRIRRWTDGVFILMECAEG
jgi:hypothetical protein